MDLGRGNLIQMIKDVGIYYNVFVDSWEGWAASLKGQRDNGEVEGLLVGTIDTRVKTEQILKK